MKVIIFVLVLISSLSACGQIEYNGIKYNKLTEIVGTEYIVATRKDSGLKAVYNNDLLFINILNNQKRKIDFPPNLYFERIEQLKIDSMGINKVLVAARTDYIGKKKFIDMRERPMKILIFSPDGQERIQLTPDEMFVNSWEIDSKNGSISIRGYYDQNKNGKKDKGDKSEQMVFDLTTLKEIK